MSSHNAHFDSNPEIGNDSIITPKSYYSTSVCYIICNNSNGTGIVKADDTISNKTYYVVEKLAGGAGI